MRIDSHQHFWRFNPADYSWMQPDWPIRRDFLPVDLEPELRTCKLDGCVAVQARQSLTETRWLLELATAAPTIRGVVGWVDLRSPTVTQTLAEFAAHPKFVGVRHVVQDEPDDGFMLREDFQRGIATLHDFDLSYDLLVFPRQLNAATLLAQSFPEQSFVVDHLAKPPIKSGALSPWREAIRKLARLPNVMCKVSGLVTEADWKHWQRGNFQPYLEVAFDSFGPERLMFGSDWPVCLLAGDYPSVFALVENYVSNFGPDVAAKFFGENAVRFYGLS